MPVETPWSSHNQSPFLKDREKISEKLGEKVEMRTQTSKMCLFISVCLLALFEQERLFRWVLKMLHTRVSHRD